MLDSGDIAAATTSYIALMDSDPIALMPIFEERVQAVENIIGDGNVSSAALAVLLDGLPSISSADTGAGAYATLRLRETVLSELAQRDANSAQGRRAAEAEDALASLWEFQTDPYAYLLAAKAVQLSEEAGAEQTAVVVQEFKKYLLSAGANMAAFAVRARLLERYEALEDWTARDGAAQLLAADGNAQFLQDALASETVLPELKVGIIRALTSAQLFVGDMESALSTLDLADGLEPSGGDESVPPAASLNAPEGALSTKSAVSPNLKAAPSMPEHLPLAEQIGILDTQNPVLRFRMREPGMELSRDPALAADQRIVEVFPHPVFYPDEVDGGRLKLINIELSEGTQLDGSTAWEEQRNTLKYRGDSRGRQFYRVGEYRLRMAPLFAGSENAASSVLRQCLASQPSAVTRSGDGGLAAEGILGDGVIFLHDAGPGHVKEFVTLPAQPALPTAAAHWVLAYRWEAEDLVPEISGEEVIWENSAGESIFRLPPPVAWDANGEPMPVSYRLRGNIVGLVVPADALRGATYPVVLDPTVTTGSSDISANASSWYKISGKHADKAMYARLALPDLTGFTSISQATFNAKILDSLGSGLATAAYCEVESAWTESSGHAVLEAFTFAGATATQSVTATSGWVSWDILGTTSTTGIAYIYAGDASPDPATVKVAATAYNNTAIGQSIGLYLGYYDGDIYREFYPRTASSGNVPYIQIVYSQAAPPTANFSVDVTSGGAPLEVEFTDTSNGNGSTITAWSWSFGDGNTSTTQNPTHEYTTPGTYTVALTVTTGGGSDGESKTDYIDVDDVTPPVITLLGDNPVDTPLGGTYIDAGATALDASDGDLTSEIVIGGDTVDDETLGEYVITYDVSDSADNDAEQVTRTVNVKDLTPPVITLTGDNPHVIAFESLYSDPGATAADSVDGDLTEDIVVSGDTVNTSVSGNYTVYYDVEDAAGNEAETVSRTVTVLGPPQTLTVAGPVDGDVIVTPPDPAHVVESGTSNHSDEYDFGTEVFLHAVPEEDHVFWAWGGDLFGASPEVHIADEFDDQVLDPAWIVTGGTWSEAGEEHLSVAAEASVTPQLTRSHSLADFNVQLDYRRVSGTAPFEIVLRWEDASNHLFLSIEPGEILLKEKVGGGTGTLASAAGAASGAGEWHHLEIELIGAAIRVWRKPLEGPEILLLSAEAATLETSVFGFTTGADTAYDLDRLLLEDLQCRASVIMDEAHTVSAMFLPEDITPPVLSLLGGAEILLNCGESFSDPGATAFDERYGILTQNIMTGGDTVDLDTPGTYTITYDVMDRDGNAAAQITRDVVVGDTTSPVITLLGGNPLYLARNGTYTDPGATVADNCDTALPSITVDSTDVNSAAFGSYAVTYNVSDAENNAAAQVTRTVVVTPTLAIAKTNAGNTTPALGSHFYPMNAVVSLSATPPANFSHWEGDDINLETDNPINISMNGDKSVTAVFHAGIYFPDANLEQAVRDAIDKPSGTILPSDLENLSGLDAEGYGIEDIGGIQQIPSLTSLVLSGNSISDLGPLAYLTGLTHLELSNVNPSSIEPLGALTALAYLDLSGNELEDVSDLEGLDALAELDLSDNDIEDLQGLIDTRILEGGTLDLTDNPLGPLAWHVQLDLVRGHVESVTVNDVLGHGSDGLRTLVAGVKQGLGAIAINTVPSGGVEAHELRNYEDETYDLWLAEYPADTGTFDAPSNPVSLTAEPADGDGHLDYWMGSYLAYGPRDGAELSVILYEDTKLNAIIEGRPGVGTLDLVADFEDFVAEVLPAKDWETLDENGIGYDGELNPVFTGNGIPDAAELGLLNAVLGSPELDLSAEGGVASSFVWEGWEQNLAAAEAQLAPAIAGLPGKSYISRIVAAYMTLGDEASVEWINAAMDAYTDLDVLDYGAYKRRYQRFFPAGRDADNDGATNLEEWEGLALTEVLPDDIAAFTAAALDRGALPAPSGGGGASTGCAMTDCLQTVDVKVANPDTPLVYGGTTGNSVRATRGDTGQALPLGTWVSVPVGTEIRVAAQTNYGGKFRFMGWSAPGLLIDGSRALSEKFTVVPLDKKGGQLLVSAVFQRNRVTVPEDGGPWSYSVSGAAYGYHGAVYGGRWDDEEPYENYFVSPFGSALLSATYAPGNLRERWQLDGGFNSLSPNGSLFNPVAVRGVGFGKGLTMTGGEDIRFVGLSARNGTLEGGINGAMYGCSLFFVADIKDSVVRVDASANPGYAVNRIDIQGPSPFSVPADPISGTWALLVAGRESSARAVCLERVEYELTLLAGGDDPACSGYVIAEPALKYYVPGMEVSVKAKTAPGYVFAGWSGGGTAKEGGVEKPLDQCVSKSISVVMNGDRTVTAKFGKMEKPEISAALESVSVSYTPPPPAFLSGTWTVVIKLLFENALGWYAKECVEYFEVECDTSPPPIIMARNPALLEDNGDGRAYIIDYLEQDFGIPPRYYDIQQRAVLPSPLPCTFTTLQKIYLSPTQAHIEPLIVPNGPGTEDDEIFCIDPNITCTADVFEYKLYQQFDISFEPSQDRYRIELTITEAEEGELLNHVEYVYVP